MELAEPSLSQVCLLRTRPSAQGQEKRGDTFPSLSLAHVTPQHITPCTAPAHDRQCGLSTLENENPRKTAGMDLVNDGNDWVSGERMSRKRRLGRS